MTETTVNRLLHDAEHADSGASFAALMYRRDPLNKDHLEAMEALQAKRDRLIAEALALDPDRTDDAWEETTLEIPS